MDKAVIVSKEMMSQRFYLIKSENIEANPPHIIIDKNDGSYLIIVFCLNNKLNKSLIKDYLYLAEKEEVNHMIFVYKNKITSSAKSLVEDINNMSIELFTIDELQYNLTKHRLVPKHEKMEETKAKEIRKKLENKLPDISFKDPVSRFYGFKRGDIIKITRKEDEYNYIIYRMVK